MTSHLPLRRLSPQRGGILFKLISLITFLAFLFVLYLFRQPILRAAGEFFVIDEAPEKADAIVILGDDNFFAERAERAAQLYRAGWAPRVIASGRQLRPYVGVSELMQRDLTDRGVPDAAVIRLPHRASSTLEEAVAIRELLERNAWRRVLIVTSQSHTRRSRYIFRRILPDNFQLIFIGAADSAYHPHNWWHSRSGVKTFFYEAVGLLVASWELRNSQPPPSLILSPAPAH